MYFDFVVFVVVVVFVDVVIIRDIAFNTYNNRYYINIIFVTVFVVDVVDRSLPANIPRVKIDFDVKSDFLNRKQVVVVVFVPFIVCVVD